MGKVKSLTPKTVDLLIKKANQNKLITFEEVANHIGTHPRVVGRILWLIGGLCSNKKLPPLTAIIIRADTRKPGEGFWVLFPEVQESDRDDKWAALLKEVYSFDWWKVARELYDGES